jgi:hypothetical protein
MRVFFRTNREFTFEGLHPCKGAFLALITRSMRSGELMERGLGLRLHPNYYALVFYLLKSGHQFFYIAVE